jgi:hypothetical protein
MSPRDQKTSRVGRPGARNRLVWTGGLLAALLVIAFFAVHWEYYGLDRVHRPEHGLHPWLRSSGRIGLPFGIGASVLFVMNLGYLVRKRLVRWTFLGALRRWMELHVLTGFLGGGLVLIHSSLAPSSALGTLALVSMAVTLCTGIVGRMIYVRVPRSKEGRELEFAQVKEALAGYRAELERGGVRLAWLESGEPAKRKAHAGLVLLFRSLAAGMAEHRREYRRLKETITASETLRPAAADLLPLAKAYAMHAQWFSRYSDLRALIATWRFFHRWMAVLMLCVVACHIVVAVWFGMLGIGASP